MNLANKITLIRIVLIPLFIVLLLNDLYFLSANVFVIASLTDALDGYIARKYNMITNMGKLMDPLADKLLVTSALICLVEKGDIASWLVIIIISREFLVSLLRSIAASEGTVIAASKWGKMKTIFQMVAIISILYKNYPFELINFPFSTIAIYIATVLTLISGVDYILKNKHVFKEGEQK